jgi:hypothetical protein
MKSFSSITLHFLFLTIFFGCAKEKEAEVKTEYRYITVSEEINEITEERENSLTTEVHEQEVLEIEPEEIEMVMDYGETFCQMMKEQEIDNPFELEKFFSQENQRRYESRVFEFLKSAECRKSELVFNKYPLQLVKLDISDEYNFYIGFKLDRNNKIISLRTYYGEGLIIRHYDVPMADGKKLTTFFYGTEEAKTTFLWRTPYINTHAGSTFSYYELIRHLGVNMVLQANRGSFYSEGKFRWLHKENISDGEATVDWISKQSFNNGTVIPFGASYPGFNALAAAASGHPAIAATISCSSPTNARTDSLTNGAIPTPSYIDYVNEREIHDGTTNIDLKAAYLSQQGETSLRDFDQELFGRRLVDWQEFVDSYETKDGEYWKNRNILSELHKIKKPVFHIAGLNKDQDSRDTVLTYQYIEKQQLNPALHQLYLHSGGHGCGEFMKSPQMAKLLQNNLDAQKPVHQYQASTGSMVAKEHFTEAFLKDDIIEFDKEAVSYTYSRNPITENFIRLYDTTAENYDEIGATLQYEVKNNGILNGVMKLEMEVTSQLYDKSILAYYIISGPSGNISSTMSYGQFFSKEIRGQKHRVEIMFEPMLVSLPIGSKINIYISTSSGGLDFNRNERIEFYQNNIEGGRGYLDIDLSNPIKLHLPLETEAPLSMTQDEYEAMTAGASPREENADEFDIEDMFEELGI